MQLYFTRKIVIVTNIEYRTVKSAARVFIPVADCPFVNHSISGKETVEVGLNSWVRANSFKSLSGPIAYITVPHFLIFFSLTWSRTLADENLGKKYPGWVVRRYLIRLFFMGFGIFIFFISIFMKNDFLFFVGIKCKVKEHANYEFTPWNEKKKYSESNPTIISTIYCV